MTWRNDAGLSGKSVVVTGAAGGIGRSVTKAFAEAGAHVVAVDLPGSPVAEVVTSLPGGPHLGLEANLLDLSSHAGIFERANELDFRNLAQLLAVVHASAGDYIDVVLCFHAAYHRRERDDLECHWIEVWLRAHVCNAFNICRFFLCH